MFQLWPVFPIVKFENALTFWFSFFYNRIPLPELKRRGEQRVWLKLGELTTAYLNAFVRVDYFFSKLHLYFLQGNYVSNSLLKLVFSSLFKT